MDEERLILEVQQRPAIYDKDDRNHHNRQLINVMWECIAKEVGADANACKNRWGTLRDYFLKKYRRTVSGQATGRKRPWYLYDNMSFLIPFYKMREMDGKLKCEEDDERPEEDTYTEQVTFEEDPLSLSSEETACTPNSGIPHQPRKRKRGCMECSAPSDFNMEVLTASRLPDSTDENEYFFKSLLPCMKKLNDIQTMEFRLEVQSLLLKYLKASSQPQDPSSSELPSQ